MKCTEWLRLLQTPWQSLFCQQHKVLAEHFRSGIERHSSKYSNIVLSEVSSQSCHNSQDIRIRNEHLHKQHADSVSLFELHLLNSNAVAASTIRCHLLSNY